MPVPSRPPWPLAAAALVVALASAVSACGSEAAPAEDLGTLQVSATFGTAAAQVGQNTLTVAAKDPEGAPLLGATVTVDPQMPTHGHGSSETPVVTELGAGLYEAKPVTLQMQGHWVITVRVVSGDAFGVHKLTVDL